MRVIPCLFAVVLAAGFTAAQCPFQSVAVSSYGQGCNPIFANNQPVVGASLDLGNCRLDVTVDAFSGCCNTFIAGRLLALGDQPASVPLPQFGVGCTLLVQPAVILFQSNSTSGIFSLPLASALPPLTVYAQGAVLYFTTIGGTTDFALSAGAQIDLQ